MYIPKEHLEHLLGKIILSEVQVTWCHKCTANDHQFMSQTYTHINNQTFLSKATVTSQTFHKKSPVNSIQAHTHPKCLKHTLHCLHPADWPTTTVSIIYSTIRWNATFQNSHWTQISATKMPISTVITVFKKILFIVSFVTKLTRPIRKNSTWNCIEKKREISISDLSMKNNFKGCKSTMRWQRKDLLSNPLLSLKNSMFSTIRTNLFSKKWHSTEMSMVLWQTKFKSKLKIYLVDSFISQIVKPNKARCVVLSNQVHNDQVQTELHNSNLSTLKTTE